MGGIQGKSRLKFPTPLPSAAEKKANTQRKTKLLLLLIAIYTRSTLSTVDGDIKYFTHNNIQHSQALEVTAGFYSFI